MKFLENLSIKNYNTSDGKINIIVTKINKMVILKVNSIKNIDAPISTIDIELPSELSPKSIVNGAGAVGRTVTGGTVYGACTCKLNQQGIISDVKLTIDVQEGRTIIMADFAYEI